jgi:uncharacterized protein YggE
MMKDRTITIRGTGNVSAKPDLIVIAVSFETIEADYAQTLDRAANVWVIE